MTKIDSLLSKISHRPYPLPTGKWQYYQEWNRALFLHWEIPFELLRESVPQTLHLDAYQGKYFISLVAFTMEKIRPRSLPSLEMISQFDEINLRTYICHQQKKGVYFLNIEAGKPLSAYIAKKLSGLPYETATIQRSTNRYHSQNLKKKYFLDLSFEIGESLPSKTQLDHWLTERYCLYLNQGQKAYRYDIHHEEWNLKRLTLYQCHLKYRVGSKTLGPEPPQLVHYSEGVQVISWKRQQV